MAFQLDTLPRQDGRVALITGANTGLGFHNAHDLAALGAKVVLGCRTESRARDAMARITASVPGADLEFLAIDLSSLDAVRAAATHFRSRHDRLDLLINNAGIMMTPFEQTVDGFEGQMAANYWGHFLLTMSLIDLLPDDPASRVVTLSSLAHAGGAKAIRFDDVHWQRDYDRQAAYQQTKLACLMFALELDRRLTAAGKSIVSAASHPGISPTELGRSMNPILMAAMRYTIAPFVSHSPDKASLPTLVAAVDPNVTGGDYLGPQGRGEMRGDPGPARIHPCALDTEASRRLWDLSVELTGADLPFGATHHHDHDHGHHHRGERPDWDEIYGAEDQLWSGHVNGSLVAEVTDLEPGRALDVGCGEGADAIWLAEHGWEVAAVDVAKTAIARARPEAEERGVAVTWLAADIIADPPATSSFDLVSMHYPALEIERRAEAVAALTGAVAPGGLLLVVGHAPPEDPATAHFDPADWVQPDDIAADLGPEWTIELHETRPRVGDHHHDSPHVDDVVLRARKAP